jgi:hypothetical protein
MRLLASGICSLALVLSGCYVTVPVTQSRLQPGDRVRVQLTEQGADDLARYLGPNVATVDGRLLQNSDGALALSVTTVATRSGDEQFWKGEQVSIPRGTVANISARKLSIWRSGLIGAAVLASVASIGLVSGSSSGGGRGGTPPPPK